MISNKVETKTWVGFGLALLAMFSLSITYAFYKVSVPLLAHTSVIFFQNLFSLCILLPFILYKGPSFLSSPKRLFICLRGLVGLGSLYALVFALSTTNLAEATLLKSTTPLFVPFLAWIFLREKIRHSSWPYLLLGFLGIALILHPGTQGINQGLWAALISGVLSAFLYIVVRYIAHEPFLLSLFYYSLVVCIGTLPFVLFLWEDPPPLVWVYLAFASISMLIGQMSLTTAMRHLSAQTIAPMSYLVVIFSVFIDWIVWDESLRFIAFIGMAIVILSGCMLILQSSKTMSTDALILVDPVGSGAHLKKTAQSLGYHVIGLYSHTEDIYAQLHVQKDAFFEACDTTIFETDFKKILKLLKAFPHPIKGCIAGSESGVESAEKIAQALNLIANPIQEIGARLDKGKMRELLAKSNLACPQFAICSSIQEGMLFANSHEFPLVIKTPKGASSDLVFICQDINQLKKYFEEIITTKDAFGAHTTHAVLEEYIDGKEYAVNTFSDGNQGFVTNVWAYDKIATGEASALYYDITLIPINDPSISPLIAYAKEILVLFGIERGPAHLEIKTDSRKGPTLIEVGARLSGASIPHMIQKHSNFDPLGATIEVFTAGKTTVPQPIVYKKHMSIANFPIAEGGKIVCIHGLDEIKKLPSYDSHVFHVAEGDTIPSSTSFRTIPCIVFLAHEDKEQCLNDTKKAHELFSIEFEGGRRSSLPIGTWQ